MVHLMMITIARSWMRMRSLLTYSFRTRLKIIKLSWIQQKSKPFRTTLSCWTNTGIDGGVLLFILQIDNIQQEMKSLKRVKEHDMVLFNQAIEDITSIATIINPASKLIPTRASSKNFSIVQFQIKIHGDQLWTLISLADSRRA